MLNIDQATQWLSEGNTIAWEKDHFIKCSTLDKVKYFFLPSKQTKEINEITSFVQNRLAEGSAEKESLLQLADKLIVHFVKKSHTKKIIQIFEKSIVRYQETPHFLCSSNQTAHQKWVKYGMPSHIFYQHPEFCEFLENSVLLSQMKVTKDTVFEYDGEPAILVKGIPMGWKELQETFEVQYSELYKEHFIIHKQSRETYTYLDNGSGLQPHHPFLSGITPISKISEAELAAVTQKAAEFIRPGEENLSPDERNGINSKRSHTIQLVSSFVNYSSSHFGELITNPKHPYLRIILGEDDHYLNAKKGDVLEVGYCLRERTKIPFKTTQGHFRSPDCWEYGSCDERLVTNMPISSQEAIDLHQFTMGYYRDGINLGRPIAFHWFRQNCSTYVRTALQVAGIQVPTEMPILTVAKEIMPQWMRRIGQAFSKIDEIGRSCLREVSEILLPIPVKHLLHNTVNKVMELFERIALSVTALGVVPIGIALGGTLGEGGRAFVLPGVLEQRIDPPLKDWKNWVDLSGYTINLPGVLQRWQRKQASTSVHINPIKLTITPPQAHA